MQSTACIGFENTQLKVTTHVISNKEKRIDKKNITNKSTGFLLKNEF